MGMGSLNPLEIPMVIDLIFQLVGAHDLLSCRLVTRAWRIAASAVLHEAGWRIQLRSGEAVAEYLRTHVAADKLRELEGVGPGSDDGRRRPSLQLGLTLDITNSSEILSTAIMIIDKGYAEGGVASLDIVDESTAGLESAGVLHFLHLISGTVAHISLHFRQESATNKTNNSRDFGDPSCQRPCPVVTRAGVGDGAPKIHFPRLQSLSIMYTPHSTLNMASLSSIVTCAPRLASLRINILTAPYEIPDFGSVWPLDLMAAITDDEALGRMRTLDVNTEDSDRLLKFALRYGRRLVALSALRIRCRPIYYLSLGSLPIFTANFPVLESLEFIDSQNYMVNGAGLAELKFYKLPTANAGKLVRFGCELPQKDIYFDDLTGCTLGVLERVQDFQGLNIFYTNFVVCLGMSNLCEPFVSKSPEIGNRNIREFLIGCSHPQIRALHLAVERAPLRLCGVGNYDNQDIPEKIAFVVSAVFPKLKDLVIQLGEGASQLRGNSPSMQDLLTISFSVGSLHRIEINNYHDDCWTLGQPPVHGPIHGSCGESQLDTFTVRGVTRSYARRYPHPPPNTLPKLDLDKLIQLTPEIVKSRLLLQVDVNLLLNSGEMSFGQLRAQVRDRTYPRVKLL